MSVLQGLKVLQVGPGLGAAVCGRLFADVGADVNCFKPGRVTPLAEHLNNGKLSLTALPESTDIVVLDGGPAALAENGWEVVAMRRRYPEAAIVALSPYGQTGPDADKPATDLTLFCASAIARCLTGQVDDLSEAPVRAVGEQSAFIGGLAAACAGMHAALLGRSAFVDVSIQEALATLSMTELTKAGMGGSGWSRERLTDGNGATVCILPAKDGYAAISPREDHQWTAWLEAMGSPAWGDDPRFATKPDRVQNWDALHALMSEWSREIGKQDIADLAQKAHVPSFPLKEPAEHLESPQLASRAAFRTSKTAENSLKTIGDPFKIELFEGDPPPQRMPTGPLPLSGIRVLDFSWVIAGPTATRYLAAMGAEVIKVEAPGRGDPGRASDLHTVLGQAKQGIVLNLKQPEALEIARRLVRKSDILIENYATGVMDRLGLGAEDLRKINPNLVYISASGMGREGPDAKAVAYGTLLQCFSGFAGLNRHPETPPRVGMAWLDPMCGLKLAFIAAASIWRRRRYGGAARVDFSMVEAMLWTMAEPLIQCQRAESVAPQGNRSPVYWPHGIYPCQGADAWIGLVITNDEQWRRFCDCTPGLAPYKQKSALERRELKAEIEPIILELISKQSLENIDKILSDLEISVADLATTQGLANSPHLRARGFWDDFEAGHLPGLPWRADFPRAVGGAPGLGEHTDVVMKSVLGMPEADIAALRDGGAFG